MFQMAACLNHACIHYQCTVLFCSISNSNLHNEIGDSVKWTQLKKVRQHTQGKPDSDHKNKKPKIYTELTEVIMKISFENFFDP